MKAPSTVIKWPTVKIQDVALAVTVGHVSPMADQYVEEGVPFLRSLSSEPFGVRIEGLKYIMPDFHKRLKKSALAPGDVVIVRTGKPGACAVIPRWLETANCSDLIIVRCGPKLRPHFLCYVVNTVAGHHIDARTVGAVQQHFNVGSARTLRFQLPTLEEQDQILAVLRSLDDKIELNRKMNATPEAMARALFRDWFVDFGPTLAKMEGREAYLSPDLWTLFPDRLDSEGKPEGWQEKPLTAFFSIIGRGTPKTSNSAFWNGDISWFSVTDTPTSGSVFVTDTEKTITEEGLNGSSARMICKDTTIISARGTVGNLAVAGRDMTFNQSCYGLKAAAPMDDYATYLIAQNMVNQLKSMAHGSVFSTITRQIFESLSLPMPTPGLL